ncbi:MAG: type III pantothenate kinase [Azospira sp.]|jgi:type III pantothenate kinase|nr:type III pantothenate kinase [Azospira sp.]
MTLIAIDAGNTRVKWGIREGEGWRATGALPTAGFAGATASAASAGSASSAAFAAVAAGWPRDARIVLCNVAGDAVRQAIVGALPAGADLRLFSASAGCCGVENGYDQPERLGADRWAALVGARAHCRGACLVVCAGTATTVDRLDADGRFRGGLILPGFDLMRAALAGNTAQLPLADGEFRPAPTNTDDAIVSGCLAAQLGAIERAFAAIAEEPGARCLVTGGNAPRLVGHLRVPAERVEHLILDGLARFAAA